MLEMLAASNVNMEALRVLGRNQATLQSSSEEEII